MQSMAAGVVKSGEQPRGVTCGLCFGVLRQPLTLRCEHSYCAECVRLRLESQAGDGFACLLCNVLHANVSKQNLNNFADATLAAHVKTVASGAMDRPMCQWCEEVPAAIQCSECMFVYCSECNTAVHKSAAKRGHTTGKMIADTQTLRGMQRKCHNRGHEEYRAEFYCTQCEEMCCAYCLQVGPHRNHENMSIARAASEVRQQMSRDVEAIAQTKSLLENQAGELNRVVTQYVNSYDSVENLITERFDHFKQQLMQREVEVRKLLAALRESGDVSLTSTRKLFLSKFNALNEAMLRFERIQHGGSDCDVLEGRTSMRSYLNSEVPVVTGTGFRLSDLGDMVITGLDLHLDLQATPGATTHATNSLQRSRPGGLSLGGAITARQTGENINGKWRPNEGLSVYPETPMRLTFHVDDEVEATVRSDGVFLRCIPREGDGLTQIGVRSKELMEQVLRMFPEDGGFVTWRIRLESVVESFVGVVERTGSDVIPNGFYWRPTSSGIVDGQIGHRSPLTSRLPVCSNGDVLRFTYDVENRSLHLAVNGKNFGVLITELHPHIAACFIFYPREALTVLA